MKDKRYKTVRHLIEGGHIHTLSEIFDTIPATQVAKDLGKNKIALDARMADLTKFDLKELGRIARLIEVSPEQVVNIVMKELTDKRKWPK